MNIRIFDVDKTNSLFCEYFILLIVEISVFYYNYGEYSGTVAPARRHRKEKNCWVTIVDICDWRSDFDLTPCSITKPLWPLRWTTAQTDVSNVCPAFSSFSSSPAGLTLERRLMRTGDFCRDVQERVDKGGLPSPSVSPERTRGERGHIAMESWVP